MPSPSEELTDDAPEHDESAASEPEVRARPEPEMAPVPAPLAPIRRGAKQAFDEVAKLRDEFSNYRSESEKKWNSERETWQSERQRLAEDTRAAREAADRAAQVRPRDDGANADRDYTDAIKDLTGKRWRAAQNNDSAAWDEVDSAIRELERERIRRDVTADIEKRIADSRPPELPPEIEELEHEYRNLVVKPGARQTIGAFDSALAARGEPNGAARYRKAFEQAAIAYGVKDPPAAERQTSAQRARSLPGGGGAGGTNGGGGKPQAMMPPGWRDVAKRENMSEDEYTRIWIKHHPEMIQD